MQRPREQAIKGIAQSGKNEQRERPFEIVLDQIDDDKRQEDHAQERELVGRGQKLAVVHRYYSPPAFPPLLRNSLTSSGAGSCPVFCAKRWASESRSPSERWRMAPQNFSRGFINVAITSAPGRKGLAT